MILHRYPLCWVVFTQIQGCRWPKTVPQSSKIENSRWVPAARMIDLTLFSNHLEYFFHSDIPSLILQKKFRASTFRKMSQKIVEMGTNINFFRQLQQTLVYKKEICYILPVFCHIVQLLQILNLFRSGSICKCGYPKRCFLVRIQGKTSPHERYGRKVKRILRKTAQLCI